MGILCCRAVLFCFFFAAVAGGETRLHLKNLRAAAGQDVEDYLAAAPRRRNPVRSHVVVQFQEPPRAEQIEELERRGATVVGYLPEFGLVLSAENYTSFGGLGLRWAGRLRSADKLSPLLDSARPARHFLVEFFPDVDALEASALIREHLLAEREHPDLRTNEFLVEGDLSRVASLAEWDEVSYVYPASEELVQGERMKACAGAFTVYGPLGQYVARAGEGWDGPGQNAAELGYFFSRLAGRLPRERVEDEISRALAEWAKHAALTFLPSADESAPRTLRFLFAAGWHGDPFPFDGRGKILAHAFYPAPPNPEPIAGDLHFDDDETWAIGDYVDLFTVALHEIGHALGLGHSDRPGSVMYPYYRKSAALAADDIAAIRELYAARDGGPEPPRPPTSPLVLRVNEPPAATTAANVALSGSVEGGAGDPQVAWATDRGFAGSAQGSRNWTASVPLAPGANRITITARDAEGAVASRSFTVERREEPPAAPALAITSPTSAAAWQTTRPVISLAGTAAPDARVTWSNSRGGSGAASGSREWRTGPIPLQPGANVITVTASVPNGASASRSLTVTYSAGTDTVAPSLTITSPAATSVLTYSSAVTVRGTAADNTAVKEVTWTNSGGASGVAQGTAYWTTGEIPLNEGTNTIVVRARDAAGNTGWRSVVVTRRKR